MNNTYDGHKINLVGLYPAIYNPSHPRANSGGMVYIHILQAEKLLGRKLKKSEVVHHKDFNKLNYDLNNLIVFADTINHSRYHQAVLTKIDYVLIKQNDVYYCVVGQRFTTEIMKIYEKQQYTPAQMRAICPICGNQMSTHSKLCLDCYKKQKTSSICKRPSKTLLQKQLLDYKCFATVGNLYGVTEAAVRKWCVYYNLPNKISEWKNKQNITPTPV